MAASLSLSLCAIVDSLLTREITTTTVVRFGAQLEHAVVSGIQTIASSNPEFSAPVRQQVAIILLQYVVQHTYTPLPLGGACQAERMALLW